MADEFSLDLLQAISDWQQGGNAREKHYRGKALKKAVATIDPQFRKCGLVAFRKIDLKKKPLWKLLADARLPETISAWTIATDVAKTFKRGVPENGWQGVIVEYYPEPDSVVVNLSMLYANDRFREAMATHRAHIDGYELGMGKYEGSQSEVVIEKASLSPEEIYALGGYSSEPHKLGRVIFGRVVSQDEIDWIRKKLQKAGQDFGPWWIEGGAKDRVLSRTLGQVPRLQEIMRLQVEDAKRIRRMRHAGGQTE